MMWCIAPEASAEFVCAMETVLDVYQRSYDPDFPVVCMDDTSKQLVGETRRPLPPLPGEPERYDYEYERHGTANIFMFTEPLGGWRHEMDEAGRLGMQDAAQGHDVARQGRLFAAPARRLVAVDPTRVRVENGRAFGGFWLGMQAVARLGLTPLLEGLMAAGARTGSLAADGFGISAEPAVRSLQ